MDSFDSMKDYQMRTDHMIYANNSVQLDSNDMQELKQSLFYPQQQFTNSIHIPQVAINQGVISKNIGAPNASSPPQPTKQLNQKFI